MLNELDDAYRASGGLTATAYVTKDLVEDAEAVLAAFPDFNLEARAMTDFERRQSGLIAPVAKAPPASQKPELGPLEFLTNSDRREATSALQRLMYLTETHCGIRLPTDGRKNYQRACVQHLANLLLGDIEFMERT